MAEAPILEVRELTATMLPLDNGSVWTVINLIEQVEAQGPFQGTIALQEAVKRTAVLLREVVLPQRSGPEHQPTEARATEHKAVARIAEALLQEAIRPIEVLLPERAPTGQLAPLRQAEVVAATEARAAVHHHALLERELRLREVAEGAIKKSKFFKN